MPTQETSRHGACPRSRRTIRRGTTTSAGSR
jgi:hypothetical protein